MVWYREEYISHMLFEGSTREMFTELFGPLKQLEEEWRRAGAEEREIDLSAFGFDSVPHVDAGGNTGPVTGMKHIVLSDDAQRTRAVDHYGRECLLVKASASIEHPMSYPVSCMDDWLKVKHWYAFSEDRIDREALARAKKLREEGYLITANIPGGFDEPRQLMGEEAACAAYYEDPEMIEDMLNTISEMCLKVLERVTDVVTVDNLHVHEDMAGKSGPLAGPKQIKEFIGPYYAKIWREMKARGARLFAQDSDGNMNPVIDAFLDTGLNVMYPFEPGSGMDMVETRKKYGKRLAIKGGIDKYALLKGKPEIRAELEKKLSPEMRGGGTIFGLDHRIPNGVTLENYKYYVNTAREMLGLPGGAPTAHVRMAF